MKLATLVGVKVRDAKTKNKIDNSGNAKELSEI